MITITYLDGRFKIITQAQIELIRGSLALLIKECNKAIHIISTPSIVSVIQEFARECAIIESLLSEIDDE